MAVIKVIVVIAARDWCYALVLVRLAQGPSPVPCGLVTTNDSLIIYNSCPQTE